MKISKYMWKGLNCLKNVQISHFKYIASIVELFLRLFQSDKLLSPFIYQELEKVLCDLMQKFIKQCFRCNQVSDKTAETWFK